MSDHSIPRIEVKGAAGDRHGDWHALLALTEGFSTKMLPVIGHLLGDMSLPLRDRELMILRRAWLTGTAYQWVSHVRAARSAGLSDEEIERVGVGPDDDAWSPADRDVLNAADELTRDGRLTDGTWNALAARYDHRQLVELPLFVGAYAMLGYAQNTLRVRPAIEADSIEGLVPFD
ncbi:MAG: carboxymuconolactone decarboxylase family protein [Acidimicrobiia bacterium]